MEFICPNCSRKIRIAQKHFYHAGFNDMGFLYCDSYSSVFIFSSFNPEYIKIIGNKHPWMLNSSEKKILEAHIAPCAFGGHFRFDAKPRCPYCNAVLSTILPDDIHFIEIGKVVDGDKDLSAWRKENIKIS